MNNPGKTLRLTSSQIARPETIRATFALMMLTLLLAGTLLLQVSTVYAQSDLSVEIIAGYNLVVDSNVSSPSTYAPRVATVIGKFCNNTGSDMTDVYGYIGNGTTPGTYPVYDSDTQTTYPYLNGTGDYFYRHVGPTSDASRYIGTIPAGECRVQYWTLEYPACENVGSAWAEPPCTGDPLWGTSVKPDDDLSLSFNIWATANGGYSDSATRTMTMRNEISAMANKIEPNGNPPGRWFNTEGDTVEVGDVITSNGILYSLGNVRFGFDNDVDYVPDYNAWVQPISQPDFDPTCFRLIHTSGILTVTRSGGDLLIPFDDQDDPHPIYGGPLYFTNLPSDNTNVRGKVFYTFLALNGPCNVSLMPYQEVASGFDNEKFNGDYGAGIPPVVSEAPLVTIDKSSAPSTLALGGTTTYKISFANTGAEPSGLTLASDGVHMPLVVSDAVPDGMQLAAAATSFLNFSPNSGVTIRYSTDSGTIWSATAPVGSTSTWPNNKIIIQWWLNDPLPAGSTGNYGQFQATVPSTYAGSPFIENTACIGLGDADPFACDTALILVQGNNSIGDRVWQDDASTNGVQDTGETGITGVPVYLYWDKNGDGELDDGDILISSTTTGADGAYGFPTLPDGNYIVVVDSDDSDIPPGYTNTTAGVLAVPLDPTSIDANPVNVTWADFGFGPALTLEKTLTSTNPAYEGELVTFDLVLTNNLPGGPSDDDGFCIYTPWPSQYTSGTGGKAWLLPENATDAPDAAEATGPYADASEDLQLFGWNLGTQPGVITKVELVLWIRRAGTDPGTNQDLTINLLDGATEISSRLYTGDTFATTSTDFVIDVTNDRSWAWADFSSGSNITIDLIAKKQGNPDFDILLDAAGFRITTNQTCGGRDSTIDPLPLFDNYDASKLEFVSASPIAADSATTGGSTPYANTGTLSWDNVGPLAAGGSRTIQVTFRALEPPGNAQTTTTNYANVSGAEFGNGRPVNDADDQADVTINPTGSIGDTIWNDNGLGGGTSGNGVQDGDEAGIPGVTVNLYLDADQNGVPDGASIATTVTDENGEYLFEGLRDGYYIVQVDTTTLPGGSDSATNTYDLDSDLDSDSGTITINNSDADPNNDDELDADFGYTIPNTIYGNVWEDFDGDGIPDTGDDGIGGVTVYLYDDTNTLVGTATTDADGNYVFSDLADDTYHVVVDNNAAPLGADWSNTVDPEGMPGNNQSNPITVSGGNLYGSYDFGYHQTGSYSLSGNIYADWNDNADLDGLDAGFGGIPVTLYSDTGAVIATTTTNPDGSYSFGNLPSGDYTVVVDESALPAQYNQTENYGETGFCVVCGGQADVTIGSASVTGVDFGYEPDGYGSIGDTVWRDDNGNGLQGATEPGLDGITVWLEVDYDGDGTYQRVAETTTASGGQYLFSNLPAGDYRVVVDTADAELPDDGYGNTYVPSTESFFDVTLDVGEAYLDADFGFAPGAVVGDYVWQDNNGDGIQDEDEPGISGVTVGLYTWTDVDGNGVYSAITDTLSATPLATDVTDGNGLYLFTGLPAGNYVVQVDSGIPSGFTQSGDPDWLEPCTGSGLCDGASGLTLRAGQTDLSRDFGYTPPGVIGDYVWFDNDADGVQDDNEQGIGYVTVRLCADAACTTVLDTTQTDSDGYYSFGNLSGTSYYVQVDSSTLPTGVAPTYDLDGTGTPHVTAVTLPLGGSNLTADFGYRYYDADGYNISGTVFMDAGGTTDGLDDIYGGTGDVPYANTTVYLWKDGILIDTTTTNGSGYYEFTDLPAGDYVVSVDPNSPPHADLDLTASPNPGNVYMPVTIGPDAANIDFGFYDPTPTAITLLDFSATPQGAAIQLTWETATELDTLGFYLYRADLLDGPRTQLNAELIPSLVPPGSPIGAVYTWLDETAAPGVTYYYWLVDVDLYGAKTLHGPASAQVQVAPLEMPHRVFLPTVRK